MTNFYAYDICFPRGAFEREMRNRGLKLISFRSLIGYNHTRIRFSKVLNGDKYTEICTTPVGTITRSFRESPGRIIEPGADIQYEWWVKDRQDIDTLIYYLEDGTNTEPTSHTDRMTEESRDMDDDGLIITGIEVSPTLTAIHQLGLEGWVFIRHDWPDDYQRLLDAIELYNAKQVEAARHINSSVIITSGIMDNISPQIYRDEVLPYYNNCVPAIRGSGHTIGIHAHALHLSLYKQIVYDMHPDWIEAFTPPPAGDLSLAEARMRWGNDVFILVNIPESIFYQGTDYTRQWTTDLLQSDPSPNKALGFTEMGMMGVTQQNRAVFEAGIRTVVDVMEEIG